MRFHSLVLAATIATALGAIGGVQTDYLITLVRMVSEESKAMVVKSLESQGAIIKEIYDYKVYKGILFQAPSNKDIGLQSWKDQFESLQGVLAVEQDSVVHTN